MDVRTHRSTGQQGRGKQGFYSTPLAGQAGFLSLPPTIEVGSKFSKNICPFLKTHSLRTGEKGGQVLFTKARNGLAIPEDELETCRYRQLSSKDMDPP